MAGEVDIGTGIAIVFGTSGFTAQVLDVGGPGFSREAIDTSHMGTAAPGVNVLGNRTKMPVDLVDVGPLTLEVHFNPSSKPPLHAVAETITITFPVPAGLTNPATWVFSGFVTKYDPKMPLENKMTATLEVAVNGGVTVTAAS